MSDRSDNADQLFEVPPSHGAPSRVESKIRYLLLDGWLEEAQVAEAASARKSSVSSTRPLVYGCTSPALTHCRHVGKA